MVRSLTVTADDFGLAPEVNEAVERAHRDGVLTAASLMVAEPHAADAVLRAGRMPDLKVGLHLTLVEGRAVLPPAEIPDLLGSNGRLRTDLGGYGAAIFFRPSVQRQVAAEIEAQFEAFVATGLPLHHVDAHQHFHLHPTVARLLLEIGPRYGMTRVRVPVEPIEVLRKVEPVRLGFEARLAAPYARALRRRARAAGMDAPDQVFGLAWSGAMAPGRVAGLIANLPDGDTEIYMHPGLAGGFEGAAPGYRYADELAALVDPDVVAELRRLAPDGGSPLMRSTSPPRPLPTRERREKADRTPEPAIWFRRHPSHDGSLTKLGGLPTLAPELDWPRQTETGTPLHFLAQLDLSRLPPTPLQDAPGSPALPRTGLLFFFADMVEEMLWQENGGPFATTRVLYAGRAGPERDPPHDIPDVMHGFGEPAGGFRSGISVYPEMPLEPHVIDTFAGVEPYPGASDPNAVAAHAVMIESIERAVGPLPVFSGFGAWEAIEAAGTSVYVEEFAQGERIRRELHCPMHQTLGAARNLQGRAEQAREDGTVLLMQIDSDLSVHERFVFCDMGMAQFWIAPDDLAGGRFDRAWGTTEGG